MRTHVGLAAAGMAALAACSLVTPLGDLGEPDAPFDAPPESTVDATPDVPVDVADVGADASDASLDDGAPLPPITFVQQNATDDGTTQSTSGAAKLPSAVTAGDSIIVAISCFTAVNLTAVTDSLGNTYTVVVGPVNSNVGYAVYIAFAGNVAGGTDTVTATFNASTNWQVYAHEYSGIALSSPFDAQASASGTVAMITSGLTTIKYDNELLFAFIGVNGVASPGFGFTSRSTFDSNITEDRVVQTAGSYAATGSTMAGDAWTIAMATFRGL